MIGPKTHRFRLTPRRNGSRKAGRFARLSQPLLWQELDDSLMFNDGQTSQAPLQNNDLQHNRVSACDAKYLKVGCACGFKIVRDGCRKTDCPACADQVTKRRARRVFDRFELVRGKRPLLYTVLTVPMSIRSRFTSRREWRKTVKKVIAEFKKQFGFEFGLEFSHPIAEKNEEIFHPHMNLLWLQTAETKRFDPELPGSIDVRKLNQIWAKILGYGSKVDVHHQFMLTEKQMRHRCRYVVRCFPGYSPWTGPIRWYGKIPKMKPEVVVCPKCGQCYEIIDWHSTEAEYLEEQAIRIESS